MSLGATSIPAREVLDYLQDSRARRRILILDCCHSGAIGKVYKGGDADSALAGLADGFGSYILTASTTIQLAEEREEEGHGVFTKALIDCLREGAKDSITVEDWYGYAYERLKMGAKQTPLQWGLQKEGPSFEIGNFRAKHERARQLERERVEQERRLEQDKMVSVVRARLASYVVRGDITDHQFQDTIAFLKRDIARLLPREQRYREDLIRFSKKQVSFLEVFGARDPPWTDRVPELQDEAKFPKI